MCGSFPASPDGLSSRCSLRELSPLSWWEEAQTLQCSSCHRLASWAQVCWLSGNTEVVSWEVKVTLGSGRVQGVSLWGGWVVDELFLEGLGQNTNEHPPPGPPHPAPRWSAGSGSSQPLFGDTGLCSIVLSDALIVHTCPCCCALHIQPPSRSHLDVHLSSFTAISADSATPRRCSQPHWVDCYPVQPWKKGFTSTLFFHINRTKMRTEPGVSCRAWGLVGLGEWASQCRGLEPGHP